MNKLSIKRIAKGKNSTLSHLYLNGVFQCYLLEDKVSENKVMGLTCIPEGNYSLKLNTQAGMNKLYEKMYPLLHKGMMEIVGISNFSLVFIHIGNYHTDTKGCALTGHYWHHIKQDYQVLQSAFAYKHLYKTLLKLLANKENIIVEVINMITYDEYYNAA